jgi:RNA polymerase sigma factor (sigma-70 family)
MADPVTDDCTDLAALEAGDPLAFGRIYDRHAAVVLSFCRRVAGSPVSDCEDAMQETFLRAHEKMDQVSDCRGFRSWLLTIARFIVRERRRSSLRYASHVERAHAAAEHTRPEARASGHDAERRDDLQRLNAALDRLPDDERLAIHLQYLERDPVQSARSALGISRSGYYALLARARQRLQQLMTHEVTA